MLHMHINTALGMQIAASKLPSLHAILGRFLFYPP